MNTKALIAAAARPGARLGLKLGLPVITVALLAACGSGGGGSATPQTPKAGGGSDASLVFDKRTVHLGNIEQDAQGVATFMALNYGAMPVDVGPSNVKVLQGADGASALQGSLSVLPQEASLVPVNIGPFSRLGPHRFQLDVASSDPGAKNTTLYVDFNVVEGLEPASGGPRLRIDKQSIDGGNVPYDWPLYEQFTLRNDGDAPLALGGAAVRVEAGC
ncbi:MAG: hypothetical protein HY681_02220 [Chloroflexi bacterium]|nr:hypothetical protein [Chloroflexota bacterium]